MLSRLSSFSGPLSPLFRKPVGGFTTDGLILRYVIGDTDSYSGTNTVTDLQSNSNATLLNGPTFSVNGYLNFDGVNDYLMTNTSLNSKLSPANTSTVISHFCWIYPQDDGVIVTEQGVTTLNFNWHDSQIEIVSGVLKFAVWQGISISSSISISLHNWYYVGLTYDGLNLKAYINGQLAGSTTGSRLTPYNNGGGVGLYYGIAAEDFTDLGDGTYAKMKLGDFHVYNTSLSQQQVLNNYNATKDSYLYTNSLQLYLDAKDPQSYQGSGLNWFDLSGNSNNGVLRNSTTWSNTNGGYFTLNGTDQYISVTHSSSIKPSSAISISQWISADDWNGGTSVNYLSSLSCTQGGGYAFYIWEGSFKSYLYVNGAYRIPTVDVSSLNGFHNFVTTFDGRYIKLYLDTVLVDTVDLGTSGNIVTYDNNNSLIIGAEAGGDTTPTGNYWNGDIGQTLVYDIELSQDDIIRNFKSTKKNYPLTEIFTSAGTTTWIAPTLRDTVEYLVVGGGGGGGNGYDSGGGGGGAGGMVLTGIINVNPGSSYTVTVGHGGTGGADTRTNNNGVSGGNSVFDTITALGGIYGGGSRSFNPGPAGVGAGLGGATQSGSISAPTGGNGGGGGNAGGGGGGASTKGTNRTSSSVPGVGGSGIISTISGSSVTYGAGGNGGSANAGTINGASGGSNTGKGGGAGSSNSSDSSSGGNGGSGIVIIKYY